MLEYVLLFAAVASIILYVTYRLLKQFAPDVFDDIIDKLKEWKSKL